MRDADVIVVGAGFAGLSAAREVVRAGGTAIVLEARDRVGGRVYSTALPGGPTVDLGGQWRAPPKITCSRCSPSIACPRSRPGIGATTLVRVEGRTKRYRGTIPRLGLYSLLNFGWGQWRLERMSKSVPLDAPWKAPRAAEWDAMTLADFLDRNVRDRVARRLFDAGLETVFAAPAKDMSLLHALFYIHSGKDLDMLLGSVAARRTPASRAACSRQPRSSRRASTSASPRRCAASSRRMQVSWCTTTAARSAQLGRSSRCRPSW
jgi:monoamine oxidase